VNAQVARPSRVVGIAIAVAVGVLLSAVQARAGSTAASSLDVQGTDAVSGSTARSSGAAGTTAPGHRIDWVLRYANTTGVPATLNLTDEIGPNQSFVPGSLSVHGGLSKTWSTDGGSTRLPDEPTSGVDAFQATGTMAPGGLGATTGVISSFSSPTAPVVGAGDGWDDIFYKGNVYNLHHQWGRGAPSSDTSGLIACHVVATGAECPDYAGGGLNASSTAGTPFFGRAKVAQADFISPFFAHAAFDRSTGKLYFATTLDGTRNYGVGCVDLDNESSCGFTKLGAAGAGTPPNSGNDGFISGGPQIGTRFYPLDTTGTIRCFDYSTGATCGSYVAFPTPGNVVAGAGDRVETYDGRYLFAYMINRPPKKATISCVDLTTGQRCPGYPFTSSVGNSFLGQTSIEFLPVLDAGRTTKGVCIAAVGISTAAANTTYQCVDTSAQPIANPYPIPPGSAPSHASFGTVLVLGARAYYPQITYKPTSHTIQYQCFDFAAGAPCAGFASPAQTAPFTQGRTGNQPGDLRPYTITSDPDIPGCLGEDGDAGAVQLFDARTGALGCSGLIGEVVTDPTTSYCAATPGHASGWDRVQVSGVPAADYGGATVTVSDAQGHPVPGFEVVPLRPGDTTLDISPIPISGATAKLSATLTMASPGAGVTPQVSLTFKGDPAEVCFATTVGPVTCSATSIADNANAVTTGSNGASDAPAGDEAGTASFTVAAQRPTECTAAPPVTKVASSSSGPSSGPPSTRPSGANPKPSLPLTGDDAGPRTWLALAALVASAVLRGAAGRRRPARSLER
jgi:hypothetical protein